MRVKLPLVRAIIGFFLVLRHLVSPSFWKRGSMRPTLDSQRSLTPEICEEMLSVKGFVWVVVVGLGPVMQPAVHPETVSARCL